MIRFTIADSFLIKSSLCKSIKGDIAHPITVGYLKLKKMSKFVHIKQAFAKRFYPNETKLNFKDQSVLPTVHCTMRQLQNVSVKRKYLKYSKTF